VPKRPRKLPRDPNARAFEIVRIVTGESAPEKDPDAGKNPHAVALGKLGGAKGGKARAAALTARKRTAISRKAAEARWSKKR